MHELKDFLITTCRQLAVWDQGGVQLGFSSRLPNIPPPWKRASLVLYNFAIGKVIPCFIHRYFSQIFHLKY